MKKISMLLIATIAIFSLFSCSKESTNKKGKTAKFTISATGLNPAEGDRVIITFTGGSGTGGTTTLWKVNGETQANQINLQIGNDLVSGGKTAIVETATPLEIMAMVVGGINIGTPYTLHFKAVVDGKEENNISQEIVETFSKNLTY